MLKWNIGAIYDHETNRFLISHMARHKSGVRSRLLIIADTQLMFFS